MKNYNSRISYEHHPDCYFIYVDGKFYCSCDHGELMQEIKEILEELEK